VIATTRASAARLRQRTREAGGRAEASCIYNGFDEADFSSAAGRSAAAAPPSPQRFRLVYAGTLWNLTSVEPLVRAVVALQEAHPELASRLEVVLVGRKTPEQHALIEPLRHSRAALRELEYCPHAEATAWMASADALCLLLSDVPGVERVVSAKTFEYLALGSEILAIVPPGESAEIVWEFQPANVKEPRDVAGIRDWLAVRLQGFSGDRRRPRPRPRDPRAERYSRRAAAGELARLLDAAAGAG